MVNYTYKCGGGGVNTFSLLQGSGEAVHALVFSALLREQVIAVAFKNYNDAKVSNSKKRQCFSVIYFRINHTALSFKGVRGGRGGRGVKEGKEVRGVKEVKEVKGS